MLSSPGADMSISIINRRTFVRLNEQGPKYMSRITFGTIVTRQAYTTQGHVNAFRFGVSLGAHQTHKFEMSHPYRCDILLHNNHNDGKSIYLATGEGGS